MWKRDEAVKPPAPPSPAAADCGGFPEPPRPSRSTSHETRPAGARDVVHIGKSVVIKGELNGSEDLTIEGHVEGKIELRDHVLTIGRTAESAQRCSPRRSSCSARSSATSPRTEKVDIRDNGSVDGDIVSPRVAIAEGAHFRGSVDMKKARRRATEARVKAGRNEAGRRRR